MKQIKHSVIFFSLWLSLFLTIGVSAQTFTFTLNGAQEVPLNNSAAFGISTVILDGAEKNITVSLYFSTLSGAQNSANIQNQSGIVFNLPNGIFSQSFAVSLLPAAELKASLSIDNFPK